MTPHSGNPAGARRTPFELKGSLFTLTVIHLRHTGTEAIDRLLAEKVNQAPAFFRNAPVVIDLADIAASTPLDFAELRDLLRRHGLIPVGVRNASSELHAAAVSAGLPVMPESRGVVLSRTDKPEAPAPRSRNRLHLQPVRSGQQLYAADGDLIVLGSVSEGAEVLADGNIHIYGTLRGRALAGIKGDIQARIFCQGLEAQLVSIAGNYRIIEDPDDNERNRAVQIYLADERLIIEPLFR